MRTSDKRLSTLVVTLFLILLLGADAQAASLVGKWSGTLSAAGYSADASVTFSSSGSYYISALGISSSGNYSYDGGTITLTPSSPPGFSTTHMSLSLKGDRCTISGSVIGIYGTLSLKRKSSSKAPDKNQGDKDKGDGQAFDAQGVLASLKGRWVASSEECRYEFSVYGDGWVRLLIATEDVNAYDERIWAEGFADISEEALTVHQELPEGRPVLGGALAQPSPQDGAEDDAILKYLVEGDVLQLLVDGDWVALERDSTSEESFDVHPTDVGNMEASEGA